MRGRPEAADHGGGVWMAEKAPEWPPRTRHSVQGRQTEAQPSGWRETKSQFLEGPVFCLLTFLQDVASLPADRLLRPASLGPGAPYTDWQGSSSPHLHLGKLPCCLCLTFSRDHLTDASHQTYSTKRGPYVTPFAHSFTHSCIHVACIYCTPTRSWVLL